jgi:hypothetical protein
MLMCTVIDNLSSGVSVGEVIDRAKGGLALDHLELIKSSGLPSSEQRGKITNNFYFLVHVQSRSKNKNIQPQGFASGHPPNY